MSGAGPGADDSQAHTPGHDGTSTAEGNGHPWPASDDNPADPCRDDQAHCVAASIIRRWPVGTRFTADDVHRAMLPHVFCDPKRITFVVRELHKDRLIKPVGADKTERPSAHRGFQTRWVRVSPDPEIPAAPVRAKAIA